MGKSDQGKHHRRGKLRRARRWQGRLLLALLFGSSLAFFLFLPVGPANTLIPEASAHALPVRSDPAANAILRVPPAQVRIWFDDELVAATSHIVVENAQGQEVDRHDSVVSSANPHEMAVSLPRLPAGVYTVLWVVQSTDDGHVTEGSFVFSIARPNGTVPSSPGNHTSSPAGGAPPSTNLSLDGPTILQILATFMALLCMTFWIGGLIWETWILSPNTTRDPDLAAAATVASQRFRRVAPYLLGGILIADVLLVFSDALQLTGNGAGAFAPSLWQAILFDSRFGWFWWMRQGVALAALILMFATAWRDQAFWRSPSSLKGQSSPQTETLAASSADQQAIPSWRSAILEMVYGIPYLPLWLVEGWRRRSWPRRGELALGAALLVAFALSGHATSVPSWELGYSLAVDLLHLLGNAAWVGGLLFIGFVLLPALYRLNERQHARVFALGLPQFSALAIMSALILAITGPLNASIHLTSLQQIVTTLYGRILVVKSEFFLLMVVMSAYHAFSLRPRLTRALTQPRHVATKIPGYALATPASADTPDPGDVGDDPDDEGISEHAWHLAERMETWLRREAILGVALLLCVALLGAFFGTLIPS